MSWIMVGSAVVGGVAGKMKNDAAKSQANSQRKLAAETQRYSPWTGLQAQPIQEAGSTFGDVVGGALGGASMGQGLASGWKGLAKKQAAPTTVSDLSPEYMPNKSPWMVG